MTITADDYSRDDEEPLVAGRRYLFAVPGGFTMEGEYVRFLGIMGHRFKKVTHLRNAGNQTLPNICREGFGPDARYVDRFPGYWNGHILWTTEAFGPEPKVKGQLG